MPQISKPFFGIEIKDWLTYTQQCSLPREVAKQYRADMRAYQLELRRLATEKRIALRGYPTEVAAKKQAAKLAVPACEIKVYEYANVNLW